jgi:aspartate carbamoyltransferase regulatory subunit
MRLLWQSYQGTSSGGMPIIVIIVHVSSMHTLLESVLGCFLVAEKYCVWCDAERLKTALAHSGSLMRLRQDMSMFSENCMDAYLAARAKLPDDFAFGVQMCWNKMCIFNSHTPGTPARVDKSGYTHCVWCDTAHMQSAISSKGGSMRIRQSLTMFEDKETSVYWSARARLPGDFPMSVRVCSNADCVFSTARPGTPARRHKDSVYCSWCDNGILYNREQSILGVRSIFAALTKWRKYPNVVRAAWSKLSEYFKEKLTDDFADGRRRKQRLKYEREGMAAEDFVSITYDTGSSLDRTGSVYKPAENCTVVPLRTHINSNFSSFLDKRFLCDCGVQYLSRNSMKLFETWCHAVEEVANKNKKNLTKIKHHISMLEKYLWNIYHMISYHTI